MMRIVPDAGSRELREPSSQGCRGVKTDLRRDWLEEPVLTNTASLKDLHFCSGMSKVNQGKLGPGDRHGMAEFSGPLRLRSDRS